MGVISLAAFKTAPGRLEDHLALTVGATERLRGLGLAAIALQPIAGTDVGALAVAVNYASNADYTAALQKVQADAGWQQFYADAMKSKAAEQVESSLFADLDAGFQPDPGRPLGAVLTTQWRAKPGRLEEFLGRVHAAAPIIERMGGTTRVLQSIVGAHPMTIMIPNGFADLDAYGAYADTAAADAEWQQLWGEFMADPSADLVRSGIYVNISGD